MAVKLVKANPPCSKDELDRLAEKMGAQPPLDYVHFLRKTNGGRPEPNVVRVNAQTRTTITEFYGAAKVVRQKSAFSDRLPSDTWPVALTESGNLILLKANENWAISFWDHELEKETPLAASFAEFQGALAPFSVHDVELDTEQVVSAWIDPSLLKGR